MFSISSPEQAAGSLRWLVAVSYAGEQSTRSHLVAYVYGETPVQARQRAETVVALLHDHEHTARRGGF